jgi:uncharacterized membrane protein YfbV (UPF0208 family)
MSKENNMTVKQRVINEIIIKIKKGEMTLEEFKDKPVYEELINNLER